MCDISLKMEGCRLLTYSQYAYILKTILRELLLPRTNLYSMKAFDSLPNMNNNYCTDGQLFIFVAYCQLYFERVRLILRLKTISPIWDVYYELSNFISFVINILCWGKH